MKTIVIVHHTGEWGGGTKSLIDLCEMLKSSYKVIVCIPKGYPNFASKISEYGCITYEVEGMIPFLNVYSGRPPIISVTTMRSIRSLKKIRLFGNEILSLNPDVVIFNSIITAISARYLSNYTKVICIDRETLNSSISIALYRKLLDGKLDAMTFLAKYEMNKLNFKKTNSIVFPDCIKLDNLLNYNRNDIRKKESIPINKFVVLYMGGLSKIKGTDVIFRAMDILDDRFVLVFAGEMNYSKLTKKQLMHDIKYPSVFLFKKRVIKYFNKLKLNDKIIESGLRDSIDDLIIASDIIVFPSTSVHQPRPCIEAGAYFKPVLITDYPETEEYFLNGFNALTFKSGDFKALAQKLNYLYNNKEVMTLLGENNGTMTINNHDFYSCKSIICSLIEKVCKYAIKD